LRPFTRMRGAALQIKKKARGEKGDLFGKIDGRNAERIKIRLTGEDPSSYTSRIKSSILFNSVQRWIGQTTDIAADSAPGFC